MHFTKTLQRWTTVAAIATLGTAAQAGVISPADVVFTPGDSTTSAIALGNTATNDVYLSFRLAYTGVLNNNDFAALQLRMTGDADVNNVNVGLKGNQENGSGVLDYFARTNMADIVYAGPNALPGATAFVYGHVYKDASLTGGATGHYNVFKLWVLNALATDPQALWSSTPTAMSVGDSGYAAFDSIAFRDANLDAGDTVTMSNIQVSYVPEPGSLALLAVAGLAAGALRRRQAAGARA